MFNSILDSDLYKLTMQQAVCQKFPYAKAKFEFINRGKHKFTMKMYSDIQNYVDSMESFVLTGDEATWLGKTCPFLTPVYIDFLRGYKYNPNEVEVIFDEENEDLKVVITGPWYRTIMWDVPLMAIISEVYNHHKYSEYTYDNKKDFRKMLNLMSKEIQFADFGTRRRLNSANHARIINIAIGCRTFIGTSNVYLAYKHNLRPIGTHAHEWFMFHGAKYGYKEANIMALKHWAEVYNGNLGIALSDTYTTEKFFDSFDSKFARLFDGIRHDSGDPIEFGDTVITHYESLGINPSDKTIVFSDSLNPEKVIEIAEYFYGKIKYSFGIGTNLTNDIEGIVPMNMVIKMTACKPYGINEWQPTVKLSDVTGKHTGEPEEIKLCKKTLMI